MNLTRKEFEILVFLPQQKPGHHQRKHRRTPLGDYMEDAVSFDFIYAHVKNLRKNW
ncbi:MAG: hypothetical protein H6559_08535 [Lewinellaceae bacterium]|nr:hypothetical protein [Lewinellaceae bacterium]